MPAWPLPWTGRKAGECLAFASIKPQDGKAETPLRQEAAKGTDVPCVLGLCPSQRKPVPTVLSSRPAPEVPGAPSAGHSTLRSEAPAGWPNGLTTGGKFRRQTHRQVLFVYPGPGTGCLARSSGRSDQLNSVWQLTAKPSGSREMPLRVNAWTQLVPGDRG